MADIRRTLKFKVYSPPHTKFAALHLVDQLRKLGHVANYTEKINRFDPTYYIIYNASSLRAFPKNYIVYQTEIHGTHHFNKRYLQIIKGAKAVWEYSADNLHCYSHPRTSIVTPGVSKQGNREKDIDFLFYGWIKGSDRRFEIISHLQENIPLTVVTNKLCYDIWEMLRRTKTVINIHYHDHSPLELFRINEALSFGCNVISEGYSDRYANLVHFCRPSEILSSLEKAEKSKDISTLENLLEVENAIKKSI